MIRANSARFDIATWEASPCVQLIEVKSIEVAFVSPDGIIIALNALPAGSAVMLTSMYDPIRHLLTPPRNFCVGCSL
ncbi:MAG: hypothetical protein ACK4OI_13755, partial [Rhizobium oryzihabitans]